MSRIALPRISIVMPCYNGERYLRKALEAFFAQNYLNKRLIVVDGKSTDSSHQIIAEYVEQGYPVVWDRSPDAGISSAINIGLKHLEEGDIFGYLGADDILAPNVLSDVGNLFDIATGVDGLYFDSYSYIGETGKLVYRRCPTAEFTLDNLLRFGTIVGLQNIYLKGEIVVANRFSEKNRYSMDYDLYLRLLKKRPLNITYVPLPSTVNLMHGNISTKFVFEGSLEALNVAVSQVGYTPRLLGRFLMLWLAKVKNTVQCK